MSVAELAKSHKKFKEKYAREYAEHFKELAQKGQNPKTLFISCSDSRVVPNLITHTRPGDLFIDRNVGNLVPPFKLDSDCVAISASIEYALFDLKVENIIVCGHTHCGACKALYEDLPEDSRIEHLKRWLHYADGSKEQALAMVGTQEKEKLYRATERFNIIQQLKHLLTYPLVKEGVEAGNLFIQGWYYHIESGELEYFDPVEHRFVPLEMIESRSE